MSAPTEQCEIDGHEAYLVVTELHNKGRELLSIPADRVKEINSIADDFGLRYFHNAIHDQFSAVDQLSKSLGRIYSVIDREYRSTDAALDAVPHYGPDFYYDARLKIIDKLQEAEQLVSRFDADLARVRSAYFRARSSHSKGYWVPDLKGYENA